MRRNAARAFERINRRRPSACPGKKLAEKNLVGIRTHSSGLSKTFFRSWQIARGFMNPSQNLFLGTGSVKAGNVVLLRNISCQSIQTERRQQSLGDCHKKV